MLMKMQKIIKEFIKIRGKLQKKTLEYQEKTNLDIENIASTSQNIWRSIYEVLHDDFFSVLKFFPTEFLNQCKKNDPRNIPNEVKAVFKNMALENGLYIQVVMIRIRELDDKKDKVKTKKHHFQGKSARTKHWFDLDHEWLKEKFHDT